MTAPEADHLAALVAAVRDTEGVLQDISAKQRTSRVVQRVLGAVVIVLVVLVVGLGAVVVAQRQADEEAERQRCEDAIEGRADLREGIAGVVELIIAQTRDPASLQPLFVEVRGYLATQYGPPACAARLGLEDPVSTASTGPPALPPSPAPAPTSAPPPSPSASAVPAPGATPTTGGSP